MTWPKKWFYGTNLEPFSRKLYVWDFEDFCKLLILLVELARIELATS
jgi:hypothetical protein